MLQYTADQKAAIFALRRKYITSMAHLSKNWQRLTQQMQSAPEAACIDGLELAASHNAMDDITQQLQECVAQEHLLFVDFMKKFAHEVKLAPHPATSKPLLVLSGCYCWCGFCSCCYCCC